MLARKNCKGSTRNWTEGFIPFNDLLFANNYWEFRYDKIGKETKELYAAYMDEYDHITETVTDKYLKLNEKYAQILYKQEFLMTTGKQMKGLSYFKDPLEKIRFKIMCVKWNWTTLQNYDEWHQEPNAITEETSIFFTHFGDYAKFDQLE